MNSGVINRTREGPGLMNNVYYALCLTNHYGMCDWLKMVSTPASYWVGSGSKPLLGNLLSRLRFPMVLPPPPNVLILCT